MMQNIPKDPVILLSFINTQLRDYYPTLDEFAKAYGCSVDEMEQIKEKLGNMDYVYNEKYNQFQ